MNVLLLHLMWIVVNCEQRLLPFVLGHQDRQSLNHHHHHHRSTTHKNNATLRMVILKCSMQDCVPTTPRIRIQIN